MYINKQNNSVFIIQKLNKLKNELNRDPTKLENIKMGIDEIDNFKDYEKSGYLESLLDPINKKCVKIPVDKPIPSCTFQLHDFYNFRPTSTGKRLICMNPWFLYNEDAARSATFKYGNQSLRLNKYYFPFFFCNNANMGSKDYGTTGWGLNKELNIGGIPNIYDKYRLVSACLTIRYTGKAEEASGIIGGAITFDKGTYIGTRICRAGSSASIDDSENPNYFKYTDFEVIRDSPFYQEGNCLEGLRLLYFPLDNNFLEFKKIVSFNNLICTHETYLPTGQSYYALKAKDESQMKSGFNWIIYLMNAPYIGINDLNFRIDWYFNYECIPRPELLNYMPLSIDIYFLPPDMLKKIIEEIQSKAIQKLPS